MKETTESDVSELGKIWMNRLEDFPSLFMKHISEYASKCFELHTEPNLKVQINEEKCQRAIFAPLEYIICGEDPSIGFEKLQSTNSPSQLCGKVFKVGEPTYSCRFVHCYLYFLSATWNNNTAILFSWEIFLFYFKQVKLR